MKKRMYLLCGILAVVVIIVSVFTACIQPVDNSLNNPPGSVHTHQWGEWTVTKDATCTEKGEETRSCTLDVTHKETQEIAIDPNVHDWQQLSGTVPTCTETGSGTRKCKLCAKEETLDIIPALGHNFVNWTLTSAPTCSDEGIETATCSRDVTSTTRPIPINLLGHQWANNWKITTSPTIVQEGTETDTCMHNASHTITRPIAAATFTDIADLETYLSGLPDNTAVAAYTVKLNVNSLGNANVTGSVGAILKDNSTKYVSLDLSDSAITGIEDSAFLSCTNLISVNIPNNVTSIGESAFNGCTGLASVTLPVNVSFTSIGSFAFNRCTSLTSINIPDTVTSIGNSAFQSCAGLTSITIPSGVTSIEGSAFNRCTGLTSVIIPSSVTSIGFFAFGNNTNLTSVTFQGSITEDNFGSPGAFFGDLRDKFYETDAINGTPGTYTTTAPVSADSVWTKK